MMSLGHLLIILLIVLLLFGAGKLPQVMADLAKGLKSFKDNLNDDENKNQKSVGAKQSSQSLENRFSESKNHNEKDDFVISQESAKDISNGVFADRLASYQLASNLNPDLEDRKQDDGNNAKK